MQHGSGLWIVHQAPVQQMRPKRKSSQRAGGGNTRTHTKSIIYSVAVVWTDPSCVYTDDLM